MQFYQGLIGFFSWFFIIYNHYLVNKEQFNTHLEQMEKYKKVVEEYMREPIPEDIDVKDED